ncbi:MAG: ribosome silencing factor [Hyphomonadaceae bacterium]
MSGQSLSGQSHPDPSQADASQAGQPQAAAASSHASAELARAIAAQLEDDKAEDILEIDLAGKSSMADTMIVASGRSQRHVSALADHVARKLKNEGAQSVRVEGLPNADWVLIDAGDVIVHIFRPEVRQFYNLERIWGGETPASAQAANVQAMDRPS